MFPLIRAVRTEKTESKREIRSSNLFFGGDRANQVEYRTEGGGGGGEETYHLAKLDNINQHFVDQKGLFDVSKFSEREDRIIDDLFGGEKGKKEKGCKEWYHYQNIT